MGAAQAGAARRAWSTGWPVRPRLGASTGGILVYGKLRKILRMQVFMAALRSRWGHYIFVLFLSSFFFPLLISAVADWMSTILRHLMWS